MLAMPAPALSLSGLSRDAGAPWAGGPKSALAWADRVGFRRVALDLTAPGIRPRELDRSARRGLAAHLRRAELAVVGCDLIIPEGHFADPAHTDRAVFAAVAAIEFARELVGLCDAAAVVTMPAIADGEARETVGAAAEREGVVVAELIGAGAEPQAGGWSSIALDLPAVLAAGGDASGEIGRLGEELGQARIADLIDGIRRPLGAPGGRLDAVALAGAIAVCERADAVIDLRGMSDQDAGARSALSAWPRGLG